MRALIGLGNPGAQYEQTRHNVGFAVLDAVALALQAGTWKRFLDNDFCEVHLNDQKIFLLKPQQYMNNSGKPLRAFVEYYHLETKDLCIVADDVYVAPGTARIRQSGGDGGHNGWKSVIAALDPDEFWRVRIGVGLYEQKTLGKSGQLALDDYVLQKMPKHDQHSTEKLVDIVVPNLVEWLKHGTLSQETVHI